MSAFEADMFFGLWYDFAGDDIDTDFTVAAYPGDPEAEPPIAPQVHGVQRKAYLAGVGYDDDFGTLSPIDRPVYFHGDQIGTTRRMTGVDQAGGGSGGFGTPPTLARSTYSAFGEPIAQVQMGQLEEVQFRYGYAGAHGYQASPEADETLVAHLPGTGWGDENGDLTVAADPMQELGWLHVGERYYDPMCGRFVMRDPSGIDGGINIYVYSSNSPIDLVDPTGEGNFQDESNHCSNETREEIVRLSQPGRKGMSWSDFGRYVKRNRWTWPCVGGYGSLAGGGNVILSTAVGSVRAGISTPPHWTSWQHLWLRNLIGNGAARTLGRVSLVPTVWEGFWDIGVMIRYPWDCWDY